MRRVFGFFIYHPEKTCPRCGSMHVHRTKRGRILEYWVLFFVAVRPYRCGKCRHRFYGPKKFLDGIQLNDMVIDDNTSSSPHRSASSRSSQH
jgi:transposase